MFIKKINGVDAKEIPRRISHFSGRDPDAPPAGTGSIGLAILSHVGAGSRLLWINSRGRLDVAFQAP